MREELKRARAIRQVILEQFPRLPVLIVQNFHKGVFINANVKVEGHEEVAERVMEVVPDLCGNIKDRYDRNGNHVGTEIELTTKPEGKR